MASAVCSKCGGEYRWHGYRGSRLKDNPSPCCGVEGKANRYSAIKSKSTKYCPDCGKSGLWWRKAVMNPDIPRQPMAIVKSTGFPMSVYTSANMYCPRCKKWVEPIRKESVDAS